jgi:hypothetical protein
MTPEVEESSERTMAEQGVGEDPEAFVPFVSFREAAIGVERQFDSPSVRQFSSNLFVSYLGQV